MVDSHGVALSAVPGFGENIAMREPDATEPGTPSREIVFALVPDYSHIAFSSALEPLRMANRMSGRTLYRWRVVSADGSAVASSGNLLVQVDGSLEIVETADLVVVCAGEHVQRHVGRVWLAWLRRLAQRRIPLGAVCTGAYLLASADLLGGYRCTIHWENLASLREEFPGVIVTSELFEIDRDRYTCSGGIAPLDMMLNLIRAEQGDALAVAVSEEFICERIRGRNDAQRIPLRHHLGTSQPKLVEAIALMEANLDEPDGTRRSVPPRGAVPAPAREAVPQTPALRSDPVLPQTQARPRTPASASDDDVDRRHRLRLRIRLRAPFQQVLSRPVRMPSTGGAQAGPSSDRGGCRELKPVIIQLVAGGFCRGS